jgi:hypothetical protein
VECQGQGYQQTSQHWGKGKKGKMDYPSHQGKGDYPSYQGKGDYPPQGGWKQQSEKPSSERQKLGKLRQMLKTAETMDGWEDKVLEIREEIKEQLILSNAEQGVTREQQGAIYLQQLQWHTKEKKGFRKAMLYHQDKTEYNAKEYQKQRLEIRNLYAELEEIGWNQVLSEDELEGEGSVDSDEASAYMAANNPSRRTTHARETPIQRSTRLNLRQGRMPAVVDLTGDDGGIDGDLAMGVEPITGPPAPQETPPQTAGGAHAQTQQRPVMGPAPPEAGSLAAARMQAVQEAQDLAAARSVF